MLECANCLFVGGAAVLRFDSVPQSVMVTDSASLGTGPLCEITGTPAVRTLQLSLTRTTLRQAGPLLREHHITTLRQTPINAKLRQSVLDLPRETAVIEAIGTITSNWTPKVEIESNGSFLSGESAYVAIQSNADSELIPLDQERLDVEGLLVAEVQFTGPLSPQWNNNVVALYKADVQTAEQLGIAKRELPSRREVSRERRDESQP